MNTPMKVAAVSIAAALTIALAPVAKGETVIAPFIDPSGTETTGQYDGTIQITVSGVGYADGSQLSDAFYTLNATNGTPPPYTPANLANVFYGLGFATNNGGLSNIQGSLINPVPAYNSNNTYTFSFNTGLSSPGNLWFGVVDDIYGDNGGAYTITIGSTGTPEPGAYALLGGLGVTGLGFLRRRRRSHKA